MDQILLDVTRLVWRAWNGRLPTGIDRTALAYVEHFRDRALAVVQRGSLTRVLSRSASDRLFDLLLAGDHRMGALIAAIASGVLGGPRNAALKGNLYFNVGHTGLNTAGHGSWIRRSKVRPIYFVHDLIPITHPEYCRPGEPDRHLQRVMALLNHGAGIIANSHETLNELSIFAGLQKGLIMPPAVVAQLGAEMPERVSAAEPMRPLPGLPYFVTIGTIEARKNHLLILNVWVELARRLGSKCPQLVIIGQRGWESEQVVDMLERCAALGGHVIELDGCPDAHVREYLAGARALLFPSFAEGFGLPLVEALANNTPVIASDLAVFHELAGNVPDYLNPIDGLGWADLLEAYAAPDSPQRKAQLTRMQQWKAPDWSGHFHLVDRWLGQFSEGWTAQAQPVADDRPHPRPAGRQLSRLES